MKARVLFILEWLPEYRVRFFERLREELEEVDISLAVVYGKPSAATMQHGDSRVLNWGEEKQNKYIRLGRKSVVWQPWLAEARGADLVVVNEGVRLLLNYLLLSRQAVGKGRVALWGHGANLDEFGRSPVAEGLKRKLYALPHWWFAYTEGSKRRVLATGFPCERVTVVNNSVSSAGLRAEVAAVTPARLRALRTELAIGGGPVCMFLGSLRPSRRLDFLLAASDIVAAAVPGFALLVAGDGPEHDRMTTLSAGRPYVRLVGRVDGLRKAELLRLATMMLLPGHIGLNIIDGFAAGTPVVTTAVPQHAPEVEYLTSGKNGVMLPASTNAEGYGRAVAELLEDDALRKTLSDAAADTGQTYTEERMVTQFVDGVERAIAEKPRSQLRAARWFVGASHRHSSLLF